MFEEGCFSIPFLYANVQRAASVTVDFLDESGTARTLSTKAGLFGAAVQHEIDHLNGVLFPDHLSRMKREMFWRKYAKRRTHFGEDVPFSFDMPAGELPPLYLNPVQKRG